MIDNGYLMVDRKQTKNIYGSNLYTLFHSPRQVDGRPVEDRPAMTDRSTVNPLQITVLQITILQVTVRQLIIAQLTLRVNVLRNGGNFTTRKEIKRFPLKSLKSA